MIRNQPKEPPKQRIIEAITGMSAIF